MLQAAFKFHRQAIICQHAQQHFTIISSLKAVIITSLQQPSASSARPQTSSTPFSQLHGRLQQLLIPHFNIITTVHQAIPVWVNQTQPTIIVDLSTRHGIRSTAFGSGVRLVQGPSIHSAFKASKPHQFGSRQVFTPGVGQGLQSHWGGHSQFPLAFTALGGHKGNSRPFGRNSIQRVFNTTLWQTVKPPRI